MASPIYMWIENETGKAVKGGVTMTDEREGSIEVIALDHKVEIPTDKHSGALNGMRRHNALNFTKAIDSSSPELFQAVTTGKTLNNVMLRFYNINNDGVEQEYYRVEYEGVKVTSQELVLKDIKDEGSDQVTHLEKISMRYKKMTVTYAEGNLTHSDSWEERTGKVA